MGWIRSAACLAIALAIPGGVALAENGETVEPPRVIGGLYFGAGYSSITTPSDRGLFGDDPTTPDDWSVGASFVGNIGYRTLRDNYVELVAAAWFGSLDGTSGAEEWTAAFFGGAFRFYPWEEGVVFRAGFGTGVTSVIAKLPGGDETFDDFGLGALGSIGWETPITDRIAVGPMVDVLFIDVGNDIRSLSVMGSLGVIWR